eukprot:gene24704-32179_t
MDGLHSFLLFLSPLLLLLYFVSQQSVLVASSFLADEVIQLPGWAPKKLPSRQFSGFVDANKDGTLQMHYWFVESEMENPEEAPLVLWFNGGPGASSLYGMLIELGPLIVSDLSFTGEAYEKTGIPQLMYNEFGWQKVANILALSMPPPVGFSFCSPPGPSAKGDDCGSWNDTSTAEVTYFAIKSWLQRFPQYRKTDMFLTGESYAGVYVPMIVKQILAHPLDKINLQGFAVGDACTPPDICGSKQSGPFFQIQFLYGKSAFSNKLYEEINNVCSEDELVTGRMSASCTKSVAKIDAEAGGYWAYGFYDNCWYENDIRRRGRRNLLSSRLQEGDDMQQQYYGPPIGRRVTSEEMPSSPSSSAAVTVAASSSSSLSGLIGGNGYACGGPNAQVTWLSRADVMEALHIPADGNFFQCDNGQGFTYNLTESDLLRILIYNGDTDPCINSYQAQNWTRSLGFQEKQAWRPWTVDGCQSMGGYVTRYEKNFDYLTIRGSGHMVPQDRPQSSSNANGALSKEAQRAVL